MGGGKNYSEKIAEKIDEEVRKFIDGAYDTAQKVLKTHKKALDVIAKILVEKETLEQDEFYALLKPFKIKQIALA